jgi:hypothetical protein
MDKDNEINIDDFVNGDNLANNIVEQIQAKINEQAGILEGLYEQLKNAANAAGGGIADIKANIEAKTLELLALASLKIGAAAALAVEGASVASSSASAVCAAGAGAVTTTTEATIEIINTLLGQLVNSVREIDLIEGASVGKEFIKSVVGPQTDTIILMLEGLLTVCAGTIAVQNYRIVFNRLLSLLTHLETVLKAAGASAVLYAIGSIANLLTKALAVKGLEAIDVIKAKAGELEGISNDITAIQGQDVNETTVGGLVGRLRDLVEGAAAELPAEDAALPLPPPDMDSDSDDSVEEEQAAPPVPPTAAQQAAAQQAAAQQAAERTKIGKAARREPNAGGGKKHKKSQKKPRKKASKSKRSKKAGKKTRKKSRGKSRGKSHGKKH